MSPTTTGRKGELRLRFAQRDGVTAAIQSYFRTPLQVMQPIRDSAGCLGFYLLSPAGGVVQGDEYQIDIIIEAGAHGLLTTQAATKVYRMPHCGAAQIINIEIYENGVFEFLPDAAILFREADFYQEINVTLHPGALLIMQEIVMPGRMARGEVLQFRRYANQITVYDERGLLLYDNVNYAPRDGDLTRSGLFEGYPCWGSWYALGDLRGLEADAFCQQHQPALPDDDQAIAGISPLHRDGIAVRMVARSLAPIYQTFTTLWQSMRTDALHLPPSILRK